MTNRLVVACGLALASCATRDELGTSNDDLISDQLHNGGVTGFFFLPPMVPKPGAYGDFIPTAAPTVSIDQIDAGGHSISHLATYTTTTGPNNERVTAHLKNTPGDDGDTDSEGYFVVRWRTADFALAATASYRVTVTVPGRSLGFADIDVVTTKKEFKSVDTSNFTPLIDDDVLRIKFRIDRPAVDRDLDGVFDLADNCPTVANPDQLDSNDDGVGDACASNGTVGPAGGTVTASDGAVLAIPHGALDRATQLSITRSAAPPPSGYGAIGPLYVLAPAGIVFARPIAVTLPLPAGTTHASVYWSRLDNTGWDAVGGAVEGTNIRVQGTHFSSIFVGPAGGPYTINGVASTTWVSANLGRSTEADVFLAGGTIEALVSGGSRVAVFDPPSVDDVQPFHIDNVPEGEFILHTGPSTGADYHSYFVDSTDAAERPDLGIVVGGRSDRTPITGPTTLTFTFTGLDLPWLTQDSLEYFSSEVVNWGFVLPEPTAGSLYLDFWHNQDPYLQYVITPDPWTMDHTKDRMMIGQLHTLTSDNGVEYTAMTRATELPAFDLATGDNRIVSADLENSSGTNPFTLHWHGQQIADAFNQLDSNGQPQMNPRSFYCDGCQQGAGVFAEPGNDGDPNVAPDGGFTASADLLIYNDISAGTDADVIGMKYGDSSKFGGRWGNLFGASWFELTLFKIPHSNGSPTAHVRDGYGELRPFSSTMTVDPLITPATGIKIDATHEFFDDNPWAGPTPTPTLSWHAPTTGTAVYYVLTIREVNLDGDRTVSSVIASFATASLSMTVPAGLGLDSSHDYVFSLQAFASTTGDPADIASMIAAPFKSANNLAFSQVTSGLYGDLVGPLPPPPPEAQIVQDGMANPAGVFASDSRLFWTERGDAVWEPASGMFGKVWTSELDGSNPRPIIAGQYEPTGIVATADYLYWTNVGNMVGTGSIQRLPLTKVLDPDPGQFVEVVAMGLNLSNANLLLVGNDIYFVGDGIYVLRNGVGSPELFADIGTIDIATDGTYLYWTMYADGPGPAAGHVFRKALADINNPSAMQSLIDHQPQAWQVEVDANRVYWSVQAIEQPPATIQSMASDGSDSPTTLVTNTSPSGSDIATFGLGAGRLFYVDQGILWSTPSSGGSPTLIATIPNGGCPQSQLIVDQAEHAVFWTDVCGGATYRADY